MHTRPALLGTALMMVLSGGAALAAETHVVETEDNFFEPETITIQVGNAIEFRNTGQLPHTAETKDQTGASSFDTGNLNPGQSATVTFETPGTIDYICLYHEPLGMVGTIVVEGEAPEGSADPGAAAERAGFSGLAGPAQTDPGSRRYGALTLGVAGIVVAFGIAAMSLRPKRGRR